MAKKPAFNENELADDIDDFFGASSAAPTPSIPTQVPVQPRSAPTPATAPSQPRRRARPGPARAGKSQMTIDLPISIAARLRTEWHSDRADGNKGRTYAAIVMDAIDHSADTLEAHWRASKSTTTSRFPSRSHLAATPSRTEPVDRIGLSGLTDGDRTVLEELCAEWGAPSWTELITVALDYDLPPSPSSREKE